MKYKDLNRDCCGTADDWTCERTENDEKQNRREKQRVQKKTQQNTGSACTLDEINFG